MNAGVWLTVLIVLLQICTRNTSSAQVGMWIHLVWTTKVLQARVGLTVIIVLLQVYIQKYKFYTGKYVDTYTLSHKSVARWSWITRIDCSIANIHWKIQVLYRVKCWWYIRFSCKFFMQNQSIVILLNIPNKKCRCKVNKFKSLISNLYY